MAFKVFVNSTTADASDMNDNFSFIGAGSRLPYTQTAAGSLTAVDATYDLGASTTTWNTLYCENVDLSDGIIKNILNMISEIYLSTTSTRIEISGLNGDSESIYKILIKLKINVNATSNLNLFFNDDSATNYGHQELLFEDDGSFTGSRSTTGSIIINTMSTTSETGFSEIWIYPKTNHERFAITRNLRSGETTTIGSSQIKGSVWKNTSSTLTSLVFTGDLAINTSIQIWGNK